MSKTSQNNSHFNQSTQVVDGVFRDVHTQYNAMNNLMSLGLHKKWKREFVNTIPLKDNIKILDLACGTGDIASMLVTRLTQLGFSASITLCDPIPQMLATAQGVISQQIANNTHGTSQGAINVNTQVSHAESLSQNLEGQSFDVITTSFGLRNFSNKPDALAQIAGVLSPSGSFHCMDFFHDNTSGPRNTHKKLYLKHVIPAMGKYCAQDGASYDYFSKSIFAFYPMHKLKEVILQSGFSFCTYIPYFMGLIGIFYASKCQTQFK